MTDNTKKFLTLNEALNLFYHEGAKDGVATKLGEMINLQFINESDYENYQLIYAAKVLGNFPIIQSKAYVINKAICLKHIFNFLVANNYVMHYVNAQDVYKGTLETPVEEVVQIIAVNTQAMLVINRHAHCTTILSYDRNNFHYETFDKSKPEFVSNAKLFHDYAIPYGVEVKSLKKEKPTTYVISHNGRNYELFPLSGFNRKIEKMDQDKTFGKQIKALNYPNVNHDKLKEFANSDGTNLFGKLLLLCGKPGTGKTTYIRNLISHEVDSGTKVVFVNSGNVSGFSSPEFITFALYNLADSIVIIEEAEKLIVSREENKNSPISDLLNITDGILGDALNVRVICTFNTNSVNVDKALKRDGRLFYLQDFPLHTPEQANKFLEENTKGLNISKDSLERAIQAQLEKDTCVQEPVSDGTGLVNIGLADLYSILNQLKEEQKPENKE